MKKQSKTNIAKSNGLTNKFEKLYTTNLNELSEIEIEKICMRILLIGSIAKLIYSLIVPCNISRHDLGFISDWKTIENGHLGYIQYIYQYKHLPDFSPEGMVQFYHPPFFYIVSAILMGITMMFETNVIFAFDVIQVFVTLIAIYTTMLLFVMAKKIGIKGRNLVFLATFFSFCPIFYILGVTLNNDMLMIMLSVLAMYFTLCWCENHSLKNIIGIAISMGLAMMTKTSAGIIAPAIGFVFLHELIVNKNMRKKLIIQFVLFGIICVPLGMFWAIRNNVLYGIPFNYVFDPKSDEMYLGYHTLIDRIGLPSIYELFGYRIDILQTDKYYNIWGQTMMTMVFDEGILSIKSIPEWVMGILMMWSSTILYIMGLVSTVKGIVDKKININRRILFIISFWSVFISYIIFCFKYPYICTMNFRYIVITLVSGMMMLGLMENNKQCMKANNKKKSITTVLFNLCVIVTSICSFILFIVCAESPY